MPALEVIMKYTIGRNENSATLQQRDAFSGICVGLPGGEFTKAESQRLKAAASPRRRPHIAFDDVAEQVRKFFL
jgi:hypothetical protein